MDDPTLALATNEQVFWEMCKRFPIGFIMGGLSPRTGEEKDIEVLENELFLMYRNNIESVGIASVAISVMKKERIARLKYEEVGKDEDKDEET